MTRRPLRRRRSPPSERRERAPRLLFIAPERGLTFVEHDVTVLSRVFRVDLILRRDHPSRRTLLPAVLRRLASGRYVLVYIWFGDPYDTPFIVLLARLFGVRPVVVIGGYELAALPAFGYGALINRRRRLQMKAALRLVHTVLPTSRFLAAGVRALGQVKRMRVIPPGVDCNLFRPGARQRERLVVTVGRIAVPDWRIKGLDVFAATSRLLPDVSFAILGPCNDPALADQLKELGGDNLTIDGRRLSPTELCTWFQRAAVYAQLSVTESFGVALAEAMACGCWPVAANSGAIPEVVGGAGTLVGYGDPEATAAAIRQALANGPCERPRQRIASLYPARRREKALLDLMTALAHEPLLDGLASHAREAEAAALGD